MNALRTAVRFLLLFIATVPLMAQGTYTQIDVPGSSHTYCYGINTNGDVVGSYGSSIGEVGFVLSNGIYTTIVYPGESVTRLYGINDEGKIVGNSSAQPGFIYDVNTRTFTNITYPGADMTAPLAVNNAGTIVGFAHLQSGSYVGFEQVASGQQKTLTIPGGIPTYADGISDSGVVVGYYSTHSAFGNFVYSRGTYRKVSIPNATAAEVTGTNPKGTALVGFYSGGGFLYQDKILTTLQFPGAGSTFAYGVNAAGVASGIFYDANSNLHGFTWTLSSTARNK